jgi:Protein of unknown function (DUF1553)/Protein of unknown function (DUF1549)/Planctomycete cytochrome C
MLLSRSSQVVGPFAILAVCLGCAFASSACADEPRFFRGLNLNGTPVTIDGHAWKGKESSDYECNDNAFDSPEIELVPKTDEVRAAMIRSSRWGGNRVELRNIPPGTYTVFLYVWEDNRSETYSVFLNGQQVLTNYISGEAGHWERLGPWYTKPKNGRILITSQGGAANFSGIELWTGRFDGDDSPIDDEQLAFFEKRIRPLLIEKCYSCHSAEAQPLEGELLVDSRAGIRRGGTSGPAVVPSNLEKSLLIQAVRFDDPDFQMPPDEKLSDDQIADLEKWVSMGAPDPRSTATIHEGKKIDIEAARQFWSFKPIVAPVVPNVKNADWPRNDLDRFILAELESRDLSPAPDAEKRVLIRRVTYDLTGLPPTPNEVAAFVNDRSDNAFEVVVNRLLDSPAYGERWGRHWMDVVRYADTAGDNSDYPIPQMHRYRDWVIDAFNRDLPYDEFVLDQLSGDLRKSDSDVQRDQRLIATGYIANSRRFGSRVDDYPTHLTIEDTIDNLGRSFLGMSLACARCHDHKFDPITTKDYYGLYGIFNSTRYPWPGIELDKRQRDFVPLVAPEQRPAIEKQLATWLADHSKAAKKIDELKDKLKKAKDEEKKKLKREIANAQKEADRLVAEKTSVQTAYAVVDSQSIADAAVQIKGDPTKLGDFVPRHFPAVLGGQKLPADFSSSGRAELAQWILSPENPLPARVMANRIWQYHFGKGIVPTPNDFGKQGKPPTHPELLDHLATAFRNDGWSIKSMHRRILLSRTYQQSSTRDEAAIVKDPGNDFLSGYPRRRLEAEAIRDTLLVLGENLDTSPAGGHPFPPEDQWQFTQHNPFKEVYENRRRSVYLMTQRIQRHPFLAIFDGADPSASTATRTTTTTPLQSLYLLNDPIVHEQSKLVAQQLIERYRDSNERVQDATERMFSRPAEPEEVQDCIKFVAVAKPLLKSAGVSEDQLELEAWSAWIRTMFRLNEFVYLD